MNLSRVPQVPPLSIPQLAERWGISEKELRRRLPTIGLPGLNVGTPRIPEWRFRLATVEAWEAEHEAAFEKRPSHKAPAEPVKAGAPPGWDGVVRAGKGRPRGPQEGR